MSDFWSTGSLRTSIIWYMLELDGSSVPLRTEDEHKPETPVCGLPQGLDQSAPSTLPPQNIHRSVFYLHFLTTIAHFHIGAQLPWDELRPTTKSFPIPLQPFAQTWTANHTYQILDSAGSCVGHVILPDSELSRCTGKAVEFVFLSYANAFDSMVDEAAMDVLKKARPVDGMYDVVSCMLIERDELTAFAERCAIGKVLQDAWEVAVVGAEWVVLG